MAIVGSKNGGTGITRAMEMAENVAGELERQTDLLYRVLERAEDANRRATTRRHICQSVIVAADGTATFRIAVPAGQGWTLVSHAGGVSGVIPADPYGALYLGEVAQQNIIRGFPVGAVFSDDFQANEYIVEHGVIYAKLFGLTAAETADFSIKYIAEDE